MPGTLQDERDRLVEMAGNADREIARLATETGSTYEVAAAMYQQRLRAQRDVVSQLENPPGPPTPGDLAYQRFKQLQEDQFYSYSTGFNLGDMLTEALAPTSAMTPAQQQNAAPIYGAIEAYRQTPGYQYIRPELEDIWNRPRHYGEYREAPPLTPEQIQAMQAGPMGGYDYRPPASETQQRLESAWWNLTAHPVIGPPLEAMVDVGRYTMAQFSALQDLVTVTPIPGLDMTATQFVYGTMAAGPAAPIGFAPTSNPAYWYITGPQYGDRLTAITDPYQQQTRDLNARIAAAKAAGNYELAEQLNIAFRTTYGTYSDPTPGALQQGVQYVLTQEQQAQEFERKAKALAALSQSPHDLGPGYATGVQNIVGNLPDILPSNADIIWNAQSVGALAAYYQDQALRTQQGDIRTWQNENLDWRTQLAWGVALDWSVPVERALDVARWSNRAMRLASSMGAAPTTVDAAQAAIRAGFQGQMPPGLVTMHGANAWVNPDQLFDQVMAMPLEERPISPSTREAFLAANPGMANAMELIDRLGINLADEGGPILPMARPADPFGGDLSNFWGSTPARRIDLPQGLSDPSAWQGDVATQQLLASQIREYAARARQGWYPTIEQTLDAAITRAAQAGPDDVLARTRLRAYNAINTLYEDWRYLDYGAEGSQRTIRIAPGEDAYKVATDIYMLAPDYGLEANLWNMRYNAQGILEMPVQWNPGGTAMETVEDLALNPTMQARAYATAMAAQYATTKNATWTKFMEAGSPRNTPLHWQAASNVKDYSIAARLQQAFADPTSDAYYELLEVAAGNIPNKNWQAGDWDRVVRIANQMGLDVSDLPTGNAPLIQPNADFLRQQLDTGIIRELSDTRHGILDINRVTRAEQQEMQGASTLFNLFNRYSTAPGQDFVATVGNADLASLRAGDQFLAGSDVPYWVDWQEATMTREGFDVPIRYGRPENLPSTNLRAGSTLIAADLRRMQRQGVTSLNDVMLRDYGPVIADALETGSGTLTGNPAELLLGYQSLTETAARYNLHVSARRSRDGITFTLNDAATWSGGAGTMEMDLLADIERQGPWTPIVNRQPYGFQSAEPTRFFPEPAAPNPPYYDPLATPYTWRTMTERPLPTQVMPRPSLGTSEAHAAYALTGTPEVYADDFVDFERGMDLMARDEADPRRLPYAGQDDSGLVRFTWRKDGLDRLGLGEPYGGYASDTRNYLEGPIEAWDAETYYADPEAYKARRDANRAMAADDQRLATRREAIATATGANQNQQRLLDQYMQLADEVQGLDNAIDNLYQGLDERTITGSSLPQRLESLLMARNNRQAQMDQLLDRYERLAGIQGMARGAASNADELYYEGNLSAVAARLGQPVPPVTLDEATLRPRPQRNPTVDAILAEFDAGIDIIQQRLQDIPAELRMFLNPPGSATVTSYTPVDTTRGMWQPGPAGRPIAQQPRSLYASMGSFTSDQADQFFRGLRTAEDLADFYPILGYDPIEGRPIYGTFSELVGTPQEGLILEEIQRRTLGSTMPRNSAQMLDVHQRTPQTYLTPAGTPTQGAVGLRTLPAPEPMTVANQRYATSWDPRLGYTALLQDPVFNVTTGPRNTVSGFQSREDLAAAARWLDEQARPIPPADLRYEAGYRQGTWYEGYLPRTTGDAYDPLSSASYSNKWGSDLTLDTQGSDLTPAPIVDPITGDFDPPTNTRVPQNAPEPTLEEQLHAIDDQMYWIQKTGFGSGSSSDDMVYASNRLKELREQRARVVAQLEAQTPPSPTPPGITPPPKGPPNQPPPPIDALPPGDDIPEMPPWMQDAPSNLPPPRPPRPPLPPYGGMSSDEPLWQTLMGEPGAGPTMSQVQASIRPTTLPPPGVAPFTWPSVTAATPGAGPTGRVVPPGLGGGVGGAGGIPPGAGPAAAAAAGAVPPGGFTGAPLPTPGQLNQPLPFQSRVAKWWQNLFPFAPSRKTQAVKLRDAWDIVGSSILSATDDPAAAAEIMRAIARDPEAAARGIDLSRFPSMANQVDEAGLFHFDPMILANEDVQRTYPVFDATLETTVVGMTGSTQIPQALRWTMLDYANYIEDAGQAGAGIDPTAFKHGWNQMFADIGDLYYQTEDSYLMDLLKIPADLQRHLQAEGLNFSPGVWTQNALNANVIAAYEGAMSFTPTDELMAASMQRWGGELPTARTQAARLGEVTGSAAYLGLRNRSTVFYPDRWAEYAYEHLPESWQTALRPQYENVMDYMQGRVAAYNARVTASGGTPINPIRATAASMPYDYNPLGTISDFGNRSWTGFTHAPGTGGRVGVGEQANYTRTFLNAETWALERQSDEMTRQLVADLRGRFGNQPWIDRLEAYLPGAARTGSRQQVADTLDALIPEMTTDPAVRNAITQEVLPQVERTAYSSADYARSTAGNVMLEPSYRTNLDSWMSNFFAFSYFSIYTAKNWLERSVRDPRGLELMRQFQQAMGMENEQTGVPTRYQNTLPIPGLGRIRDPIGGALGLNKVDQYLGYQDEYPAETDADYIVAKLGSIDLRLLPYQEALLQQSWQPFFRGSMPTGSVLNAAYNAAIGFSPGDAIYGDEFDTERRKRVAATTTWVPGGPARYGGNQYATSTDIALQTQMDLEQGNMTPEAKEAARRLGWEQVFTEATRWATGFTVRPDVPPGERQMIATNDLMARIGFAAEATNPYASGANRDWLLQTDPTFLAYGSIYGDTPDITKRQREFYQNYRPSDPGQDPPQGWQWPAWDTTWGQRIEKDDAGTKYLYTLVDPDTGEIRYVGQTNNPSTRYQQHLESIDTEEGPKPRWEASLYRQGKYPQMYMFDAIDRAGMGDSAYQQEVDKEEMRWIGWLYYVKGNAVNVSVIPEENWKALIAEVGYTPESMTAMMEERERTGQFVPVELKNAPTISRSPFPAMAPNLPRPSGKAYAPPGSDVEWTAQAAPDNRADFAQWLPGAGAETQRKLNDLGIWTWQDLRGTDPAVIAQLDGVSPTQAQTWVQQAQETVAIQQGSLSPILPETAQLNRTFGTTPDNNLYLPFLRTGAEISQQYDPLSIYRPQILRGEMSEAPERNRAENLYLPYLSTGAEQGEQNLYMPFVSTGSQRPTSWLGNQLRPTRDLRQPDTPYNLFMPFVANEPGTRAASSARLASAADPWSTQGSEGWEAQLMGRISRASAALARNVDARERPLDGPGTQALPPQRTGYYYLPNYMLSVYEQEDFYLPNAQELGLPEGSQFIIFRDQTRIRGEGGLPDPDYVNNPQFVAGDPRSWQRVIEKYGAPVPVSATDLLSRPGYYGAGLRNEDEQLRTIKTGPDALRQNPYGTGMPMDATQGAAEPWQTDVNTTQARGAYGLYLARPFSGNREFTQGYGEHPAAYARFGLAGHEGMDWAMPEGTDIKASAPGTVVRVGYNAPGYGNYVIVQHDWGQTLYAHLSGVGVVEGDQVATGTLLGLSGDTGNSTGPHLHFGVRTEWGPDDMKGWVDPSPYLPGTGTPGASGWTLKDIGLSDKEVAYLVDLGIRNPEEILALGPDNNTAAAALDTLYQRMANMEDQLSPAEAQNIVNMARAKLMTGNKPAEPDPNAPPVPTRTLREVPEPSAKGDVQLRAGMIDGLNEEIVRHLAVKGITTLDQLKAVGPEWLDKEIKGLGPKTAPELYAAAVTYKPAPTEGETDPARLRAPQQGDTRLVPGMFPGLTQNMVRNLASAGIVTLEQLKTVSPQWLDQTVKDVGPKTADDLKGGAADFRPRTGPQALEPGLIKGLGEARIADLAAANIFTLDDLATAKLTDLDKIPGIGPTIASDLISGAAALTGIKPALDAAGQSLDVLPGIGATSAATIAEKFDISTVSGLAGFTNAQALADAVKGLTLDEARTAINEARKLEGLPPLTSSEFTDGRPSPADDLSALGLSAEQLKGAKDIDVDTANALTIINLGVDGIMKTFGVDKRVAERVLARARAVWEEEMRRREAEKKATSAVNPDYTAPPNRATIPGSKPAAPSTTLPPTATSTQDLEDRMTNAVVERVSRYFREGIAA